MVGPSSPPEMEKSRGKRQNLRTFAALLEDSLLTLENKSSASIRIWKSVVCEAILNTILRVPHPLTLEPHPLHPYEQARLPKRIQNQFTLKFIVGQIIGIGVFSFNQK